MSTEFTQMLNNGSATTNNTYMSAPTFSGHYAEQFTTQQPTNGYLQDNKTYMRAPTFSTQYVDPQFNITVGLTDRLYTVDDINEFEKRLRNLQEEMQVYMARQQYAQQLQKQIQHLESIQHLAKTHEQKQREMKAVPLEDELPIGPVPHVATPQVATPQVAKPQVENPEVKNPEVETPQKQTAPNYRAAVSATELSTTTMTASVPRLLLAEGEEDATFDEDAAFVESCMEEINTDHLEATYDDKPSKYFTEAQWHALAQMQKLWNPNKPGTAWNWNCKRGDSADVVREKFNANKRLWNDAQVQSIGDIVKKYYLEAVEEEDDEKYYALIKRVWYKTDMCYEGLDPKKRWRFAQNEDELLSRYDTMVYLNRKKIAENDCMGLERFPHGFWTKFGL